MWEFISTLFTLWCIYALIRWMFPNEAEKERRRIAKIQNKLGVLVTGVWSEVEHTEHPSLNQGLLVKWVKTKDGMLAVFNPAAKKAEVFVQYFLRREGYCQAGSKTSVHLRVEGIGYIMLKAPADCVYEAGREEGALKKGDIIAMLHTDPEYIKEWRAEQARIEAEADRKKQEERQVRLEREREERRQWQAGAEERQRQAAELEKEQIARKLKEQQRRRELEKQVRQELIDSGELFGDQTKRPPIPREVADAVYSRDQGRCVYCGSTENLQFDHIIPFSKGGATSLENLQLLCQKCNLEKSNKIG